MPKMKTHKGTAKRLRLTKKGKVMRMKAGRNHLRRKKKASKRSDYRHPISSTDKTMIKIAKNNTGGSSGTGNGSHTGNR